MKPITTTPVYEKPPFFERTFITTNRWTANVFWDIVDFLAFKHPKISCIYEQTIARHYQKEYKKFGIKKKDKVLHIGCGSYPLTEITLASQFCVKVVGVDNNPAVVEMAKQIIKDKNLQDKVTIKLGDGINYPINSYDVIIVSSCSVPKTEILYHIMNDAKKKSRIIFRELESATNFMIKCIQAHEDISFEKQLTHRAMTFMGPISWNAVLLTKK